MKNLTIIFIILLLSGCSPKECVKDDPFLVEQVVKNYFKAIADGELDKLYILSTEDFILYEDGLIWNNDSLIKTLEGYNKMFPGAVMSNEQNNFETIVDCNIASTRYANSAKMVTADTSFTFKWIESATFIKKDGVWKLKFMHSTVIK